MCAYLHLISMRCCTLDLILRTLNVLSEERRHKKLCFNVLCANHSIRRYYTKSDPRIELLEDTPVIKEHLKKIHAKADVS